MIDTNSQGDPLGSFIRAFYDARRTASRTVDLIPLARFLAPDVRWREPEVGAHVGALRGRDAVLDMIHRALDASGGSFDLSATSTIETVSHVASSAAWTATRDGHRIAGRELASQDRAAVRIRNSRHHF